MSKFYMNPETGSVDTLDGWYPYDERNGLIEVIPDPERCVGREADLSVSADWIEVEK